MAAPALLSIKTVHGLVVGQAVDVSKDRLLLDINGPVELGIELEFRLELPGADETILGSLRLRRSGRGLTQADVISIADEDREVFDLWWRSWEEGRIAYRPSVVLGRGGGRAEMHGASETETESALARIDARRARFRERFDQLRGEPTEEDTSEIFIAAPRGPTVDDRAQDGPPPAPGRPAPPQRPRWMDLAGADAAPLCPRPDGHFGTNGQLRQRARRLQDRYDPDLLALVNPDIADEVAAHLVVPPDLAALDDPAPISDEATWDPTTWEDPPAPTQAVSEVLAPARSDHHDAPVAPDDNDDAIMAGALERDDLPTDDATADVSIDKTTSPVAPTPPSGPLVARTGTPDHPIIAVAWSDRAALSTSLAQGLAAGIIRLPNDVDHPWPAQATVHILTPGGIDLEAPGLRLGQDGDAQLYQLRLSSTILQQLQQEGLQIA